MYGTPYFFHFVHPLVKTAEIMVQRVNFVRNLKNIRPATVWARVRTDLTTAKNARSKIMVCSGRLPESYICSCHILVKLFEAHFTLSIFCFFVKWWLKVSYCDLDSWEEGFSLGCLQYVPHSTTQILGQHACDGYISKISSRPFNPTSGWWTNALLPQSLEFLR